MSSNPFKTVLKKIYLQIIFNIYVKRGFGKNKFQ